MNRFATLFGALVVLVAWGSPALADDQAVEAEVARLMAKLRQHRIDPIEAAQRRLVEIGAPAIPALVAEVTLRESVVGPRNAAKTLAMLGESGARALGKLLEDDTPRMAKHVAAQGLGAAGEPGARIAARFLGSDDRDRRYWGSIIVCTQDSDLSAAVPAMIDALNDSDAVVRRHCAIALGEVGPSAQAAVPALVRALGSQDGELRQYAAGSLAQLKVRSRYLPAILRCLKRADNERAASSLCEILEKFGPAAKAALPALKKRLASQDPYIRVHAARAVWTIGGDPTPILTPLMDGLEDEVGQFTVLETLAELGAAGKPAVPAILTALDRDREDLRAAAAVALGRIGVADEAVLKGLRKALRDNEASVRVAAAGALWSLRRDADEVVPTVVDIVRGRAFWEPPPGARADAATLLAAIGKRDKKIIAALKKLARHDEPEPREAARRALKLLTR